MKLDTLINEERITEATKDFSRLLDKFIDAEKIHSMEGNRGVKNLAKICKAIGYTDSRGVGNLGGGVSLGNITEFLEDNPGALEKIVEFIHKNGKHAHEWADAIGETLDELGLGDEGDE